MWGWEHTVRKWQFNRMNVRARVRSLDHCIPTWSAPFFSWLFLVGHLNIFMVISTNERPLSNVEAFWMAKFGFLPQLRSDENRFFRGKDGRSLQILRIHSINLNWNTHEMGMPSVRNDRWFHEEEKRRSRQKNEFNSWVPTCGRFLLFALESQGKSRTLIDFESCHGFLPRSLCVLPLD